MGDNPHITQWRSSRALTTLWVIPIIAHMVGLPLQISEIRQMPGRNRHECTLSDGKSIIGGVTGPDVTAKINAGDIKDGTIIEMTDYACNFINGLPKMVVTGASDVSVTWPVSR